MTRLSGEREQEIREDDARYIYPAHLAADRRELLAELDEVRKRLAEAEAEVKQVRSAACIVHDTLTLASKQEHDSRVKAEELLKRAADKIHVHACGLIRPPHDCASLHRVIDAYFATVREP